MKKTFTLHFRLFVFCLMLACNLVAFQGKAFAQHSGTGFSQGEIMLYPNPVQERINIRLNLDEEGLATMSLFDILGNDMKISKTIEVNEAMEIMTVPIATLRPGMYLVKVQFQGRYSKDIKIGYYRINVNG